MTDIKSKYKYNSALFGSVYYLDDAVLTIEDIYVSNSTAS